MPWSRAFAERHRRVPIALGALRSRLRARQLVDASYCRLRRATWRQTATFDQTGQDNELRSPLRAVPGVLGGHLPVRPCSGWVATQGMAGANRESALPASGRRP